MSNLDPNSGSSTQNAGSSTTPRPRTIAPGPSNAPVNTCAPGPWSSLPIYELPFPARAQPPVLTWVTGLRPIEVAELTYEKLRTTLRNDPRGLHIVQLMDYLYSFRAYDTVVNPLTFQLPDIRARQQGPMVTFAVPRFMGYSMPLQYTETACFSIQAVVVGSYLHQDYVDPVLGSPLDNRDNRLIAVPVESDFRILCERLGGFARSARIAIERTFGAVHFTTGPAGLLDFPVERDSAGNTYAYAQSKPPKVDHVDNLRFPSSHPYGTRIPVYNASHLPAGFNNPQFPRFMRVLPLSIAPEVPEGSYVTIWFTAMVARFPETTRSISDRQAHRDCNRTIRSTASRAVFPGSTVLPEIATRSPDELDFKLQAIVRHT